MAVERKNQTNENAKEFEVVGIMPPQEEVQGGNCKGCGSCSGPGPGGNCQGACKGCRKS